jgi:hypothetical protein
MKVQALTLTAPGIAQSIILPVVVGQSKSFCQRFGLSETEVDVYALLDTGATSSSISNTLAASLGLEILDICRIETAGGIITTNAYSIDITLRSMVSFLNIHAGEFSGNSRFDIIIGMDILTQGDLAITNGNGRTVVSFRVPPDPEHIDYVKIARQTDAGQP